jgi:glycosyltransferase involved in cell wall biosynthesis
MEGEARLNILFVGAGQSPHMHGWEAYFVGAGHRVHLLTWHQPGVPSTAAEPGVRVHYLPAQHLLRRPGLGLVRSLWAGLYIRYLARRYAIDLVHAHQIIPYGFWAALSGTHPLVLTAWGSDILTEPYASRRAMRYTRYALQHADLLTADSEHLRRAAVALGCRAPSTEVQLGVDTGIFRPGRRDAARRTLGYDADTPLVLSPRALSPVYNIESIIDSVPLVRNEVPAVRYIIKFGYGAGREAMLRQRAAALGVGDAVEFVGFHPMATMADYYAAADVCVSVASSDSSPKSVLEALACGTPVVLSDLPWVHEHITGGEQALLVAPGDTEALARGTVRLLRDPALRARMGAAGRQMVVQHADYAQSMARMDKLYRALAARQPPALAEEGVA